MTGRIAYAWILYSVSRSDSTLVDIIGQADYINHAIPTHEELRQSFGWLRYGGLVRKSENRYLLTRTGQQIMRQALDQKTMMQILDKLAEALGSIDVQKFENDDLSEAQVKAAYLEYRNRIATGRKRASKRRTRGGGA